MLTGDKLDTAENISLSCNLISKENKNYRISASSDLKEDILSFFTDFGKTNGIEININKNNEEEKEDYLNESNIKPFSLIIESAVLGYIFNDKIITRNFLKIALCAVSVVCCRVSPLQKSQVVKEVKNINKNFITLAIGDGGNDVSMIMEAHVGIGIHGEEGMLAVQSSDFSIGEFKFLRRLLFFHGRNSLNRTGNMILYFFFKNFTFTILQFYFTFYNIASGQTLIDDLFITCFNLIFTALPLGVQALTNFDVLNSDYEFADQLMPLLYYESNYNCVFTVSSFCWNIFKAIFYSAINFFVVIYTSKESSINNLGQNGDIWFNSLCLYTNIIFVVSFSLMIKQIYWVWLFPFIIILTSWIIFFLFCIVAQSHSVFNSSGAIYPSFESGKFWFNVIIVTGFCYIFDYLLHSFEINFSGKLCNELLNNLENKSNLTTIFERSEVIKKAYIKMDLAGKPSKSSNESFSSQSENNNRSYSSNKSNSKKNDKNASFSSSKEQMIPVQNDLKALNQNNEYGVQASRIMEKKNKLKKNEMLRNTSGNSKTKKLEDTDLDIPNNKFLTSYNQKDNNQENIDNIIKVKKHKKKA
jgi:magnesium-transporting ATPase (P-type)